MGITEIIVVYAISWWLVFLAALPFGVQGQREAGQMVPGTEPGAPVNPNLKRKALITTAVAVIPTVLTWLAVYFDLFRFFPSAIG